MDNLHVGRNLTKVRIHHDSSLRLCYTMQFFLQRNSASKTCKLVKTVLFVKNSFGKSDEDSYLPISHPLTSLAMQVTRKIALCNSAFRAPHAKLVILQNVVAKCCKIRKIKPWYEVPHKSVIALCPKKVLALSVAKFIFML